MALNYFVMVIVSLEKLEIAKLLFLPISFINEFWALTVFIMVYLDENDLAT